MRGKNSGLIAVATSRIGWIWSGCAVLATIGTLAAPSLAVGATTSQSFATPGQYPFTVPVGVTRLSVLVIGGDGGAGGDAQYSPGGIGATVTATLSVKPGEKLYAEVGGDGQPGLNTSLGGLGGYNGGGSGGILGGLPSGGGGGGASDVRTIAACTSSHPGCSSLASRLVVAGGGGGAGGSTQYAFGGIGGSADADGFYGFQDGNYGDAGGSPGSRGTLTGGGLPGTLGSPKPGALGLGGKGGTGVGGAGGGGGGGIYGGGGGGAGAGHVAGGTMLVSSGGGGGGGGASSQSPGRKGVTNISLRPTAKGAQPKLTFAWTLPSPSVGTLPATGVHATKATLHGTINPNASPLSACYFTISPAGANGSRARCTQQLSSGSSSVPVSARLTGLKPSTSYKIRLVATSAAGTTTGSALRFTTRQH